MRGFLSFLISVELFMSAMYWKVCSKRFKNKAMATKF